MNKIKRAIPFIITGMIIVTLFVVQFTVISPQPVDASFWINLGLNAALIVAMSITWLKSGTDRARSEEDSAYKENAKMYAIKIGEIEKNSQLSALSAFCKQKTQELLDERVNAILAGACIDRAEYERIKTESSEALKAEGYSRKQRRVIVRIRNGGGFMESLRRNSLKIKPIRALELTTNNKVRNMYDVQYNEEMDKAISVLVRAIKSIVTGAALAYISFELASNFQDVAAWATFMTKLVAIAFAAWSSEKEGYELIAVTKNKVILNRMAFLCLFNEWAQVPRLERGTGE